MKVRVTKPPLLDKRFILSVSALVVLTVAVTIAGAQLWRSWRAQELTRRAQLIESLDYSARIFRDEMLHSATEQRMRFVAPITASLPQNAPLLSLDRFAEHTFRELKTFGLADDTLFGAFRVLLNSDAAPEFAGVLARDSLLRQRVLKPVRTYSDQLVAENFVIVVPAVRLVGLINGDQLAVVFAHQRVIDKGVVAIYGVTHSRLKHLRRNSQAALSNMPILPPGIGGPDWREDGRGFAMQAFVTDSAESRGSLAPESLNGDPPDEFFEWLPSNKVLAIRVDDNFGTAFKTENFGDTAWVNSPWVGRFRADSSLNSNVMTVVLRKDRGDAFMLEAVDRTERLLLGAVVVLAMLAAAAAIVQLRRQHDLIRTRADFVSAVSHELRTPLAQIRMFSETLLMGRARSPEQGNRWLRIINRESERMTHLVESILLFSRSERNGTRLAREVNDLCEIVREATDAFLPIASAKSVTIVNDLVPHAVAFVDAGAIRQVLVNLLDNAVKYGPEGQTVTVKLQLAPRNTLELSVTDQGSGVPKSQREAIWKPFVRLDQEDGSTGGSGLGLSVVRDLVERHGGRILVADNPEQRGARFFALFPRGIDGPQLAEAEIRMERQRVKASEREAFAQTPVFGSVAVPRAAEQRIADRT
ncbi:MAG: HAMP domain-containing histidine kinase [Phycisphaerae bacterium]|nr:HAMP domain-containing histidine kinase [Gemmatimonadaceae bacterium]